MHILHSSVLDGLAASSVFGVEGTEATVVCILGGAPKAKVVAARGSGGPKLIGSLLLTLGAPNPKVFGGGYYSCGSGNAEELNVGNPEVLALSVTPPNLNPVAGG